MREFVHVHDDCVQAVTVSTPRAGCPLRLRIMVDVSQRTGSAASLPRATRFYGCLGAHPFGDTTPS
jgi:hypothetical protein